MSVFSMLAYVYVHVWHASHEHIPAAYQAEAPAQSLTVFVSVDGKAVTIVSSPFALCCDSGSGAVTFPVLSRTDLLPCSLTSPQ